MAHIPHRRQIIQRIKSLPEDQMQFMDWTRKEYYLNQRRGQLPQDSVASARIDGMPQMRVAMASEPTLRVVLTRETILERITAQTSALTEKLDALQDRLLQFIEWWWMLDATWQAFVEQRYWKRSSYQEIVRYFRAESDRFYGYVPDTEDKVMRFEDDVLAMLERLWYRAPENSPTDPR